MKQRVVAAGETLAAAVRSANAALGSGAIHVGPAPALARRTASAGWFPPHAASAVPSWVRPVRRNSSDARAAGGRAIFFEEVMQDGVSSGPTQKQLRFAETLAGQRGMQVPEDAMASKQACSAFIERMIESSKGALNAAPADGREDIASSQEARAPTEKQLQYARRLAGDLGLALPADAVTSMRACGEFIDKVPPSHKQLEFAKTLAGRQHIEVPADALRYRKACRAFIDACQQVTRPSSTIAIHVCTCMYAEMYVCMYVCMRVCMYVCMHACMYLCIYVCMYKYT